MHKLFKHTTLMNIFFAVLISIPLISIGVRCAYVTINKNAYQSYYGETINEKIETFVDYTQLKQNERYLFKQKMYESTTSGINCYLYYSDMVWLEGNVTATGNPTFDITETNNVLIYMNINNRIAYEFYQGTNYAQYYKIEGFNNYLSFEYTFNYLTSDNSTNWNYFNNNYKVTYNKFSYLDNVFEYSINQFTSSNDFGNLNFFTWFNGVFFTNNARASIYINFINWYMNYMLFVSCGYILLMMLMWFVNLARKILDRSLNIYDK